MVISSGGRLVTQLQDEGTEHIEWALGRKSAFTLFEIPKFRRFIDQKKPESFTPNQDSPPGSATSHGEKKVFKLGS